MTVVSERVRGTRPVFLFFPSVCALQATTVRVVSHRIRPLLPPHDSSRGRSVQRDETAVARTQERNPLLGKRTKKTHAHTTACAPREDAECLAERRQPPNTHVLPQNSRFDPARHSQSHRGTRFAALLLLLLLPHQ